MNDLTIVVEISLAADVETVWKALTDKQQMKEWYFDFDQFEAQEGFDFKFLGGNEHRSYWHLCTILEVEQNKKLSHTWAYEGYSGSSTVTWQLDEQDGCTLLKLTHEGLETFPADNPDFARHNFVEGWNYIINSSLKHYVEKASPVQADL